MVPSSLFFGKKPTRKCMTDWVNGVKKKPQLREKIFMHTHSGMGELKTQIVACCLSSVTMCIPTFADMQALFYKLKVLKGTAVLSPHLILSCMCPFYFKKHKCKHCIGVGIAMKMFPVPIDRSLETIGVRNADGTLKRGRKRLATTQRKFKQTVAKI